MKVPITTRNKAFASFIIALAAGLLLLPSVACGQRRLGTGQEMPEFSADDLGGRAFEYKHGGKKVLMVAFLATKREHAAQAAADIERVIGELAGNAKKLDIVIIVDDPNVSLFRLKHSEPGSSFHVILDADFELWGKFGIIATPTVIISGTDDRVLWVKAGRGYNFVSTMHANLFRALGLARESDLKDAEEVKTAKNNTVKDLVRRHLQMARMLGEKGRFDSAAREIQKAGELDPNSIAVALALSEFHLKSGRGSKALRVIAQYISRKLSDKARQLLISGRAKLESGQLDAAEKLLLEATTLNPKSSKALFELGKVYQAKEQTNKAMATYYKALSLVFSGPLDPCSPGAEQ